MKGVKQIALLLAAGALAACGGGESQTTTGGNTGGDGGSGAGNTTTASGTGGEGGGTTTTSSGSDGGGGAMTLCTPGEAKPCYTGPAGTQDVGVCKGGTETCAPDGMSWGDCEGEVLPGAETCMALDDEDCDGEINEEGAGCVCKPNATQGCYTGPDGTVGVGICAFGTQTCAADGTAWGPCGGDVVPGTEDCKTAADEDCNGLTPLCPALWAKSYGDAKGQFIHAVAVDGLGNYFIAGEFEGSVNFGGGALASAGGSDAFVAKFDAMGNHVWSKKYGDAQNQAVLGLAVDAQGNAYVTGYFTGAINFGATALSTSGAADVFVAKLSGPNGAQVWAKKFGGAADDQIGQAIALDASGNVFVAGSFLGSIVFTATLTATGAADAFVAKLDTAGAVGWAKKFGDAGEQLAYGVAADAQGNVFVTGGFDGNIDFGGGNLTAAGESDVFLAKLSGAGAHVWSKRFGDMGYQAGNAVATDAMGNAIVTGDFENTLDFGAGPVMSSGGYDVFVAKVDGAGAPLWGRGFGGAGFEAGMTVAADANGGAIVGGHYMNTVDFGPVVLGGSGMLTSAGGRDGYVLRLDATGATTWVRAFGDAAFYQSTESVALTPTGDIVAGGHFYGTVDFGSGPLVSAGTADAFLTLLPP